MSKGKKWAYRLWQWTWGLPQSLCGLGLALLYRQCRRRWVGGALVTFHCGRWGGVSLGMFLFVPAQLSPQQEKGMLAHEYGHSVQSLLLGPLYLLAVGLPSFLWANLPAYKRLRRRRGMAYESRYPESWAESLGKKYCPMGK